MASMCSQLQQKCSLHTDQTLMVSLAGVKVHQGTMHTEENKWDAGDCHSDSPASVKPCLTASASPNSLLRDHHEPGESVLPHLLNQSGNTAKVQYYPFSGSDTIDESLICS